MVNILIFSKNNLENGRGGEVFFIELATGLQKYYNIDLLETNILFGKKYLTKEEIKKRMPRIKRKPQLKFAQFKIFGKIFNFPYPGTIIKLFKKIEKNDIIYTSSGIFKINLLLMIFSLLIPRRKFIIGYHKPLHGEKRLSLYNLKYRISILLFSLFKRNFYHHTISLHAKRYLEEFFETKNVIFLIEGLELENFINEEVEGKRNDILGFLYVGFLDDAHKGVGVLLNSIEEFLNENEHLKVFFEIVGVGPLEPDVKKLEQKFPHHIRSLGYLNPEELAKIYKRNDVYLFSSRKEPFGRVLIEALAGKLIIICTRTIGSIEILRGKKFAFFLQNLDKKEFKEKIMELYNLWAEDPEKIRELQDLAKHYALSKYSISEEIRMFKSFIDKLSKNIINA